MYNYIYFDIPIYTLVAAGAVILAVIAFAIYIFLLKRRVAVYSQEFDTAIDEFNTGCNPGHPMTDEEWAQYRSSHDNDFEHASKVASSKLIAMFVRDISNANTLVDIDDNHLAYLDDARVKNGYITTFEQTIEEAIKVKRATFDGLHYIAHSESLELEQMAKEASNAANLCIKNNLLDYLTHAAECTELYKAIASLEVNRTKHNSDFIKSELARCSEFFDHVLAYPLDAQQRDAIVNGEDNCLVVSSAGSGKTSTINGKVRYLVDERKVAPEDILLITYTRKAADELHTRIGFNGLTCKNFHQLAYHIIKEVSGKPTICDDDFKKVVFYSLRNNHDFVAAVTFYMINLLSRMKDPDLYETKEEYYTDRKRYGNKGYFPDMDGNIFITKSEEERKISHFLFTHSVKFRYEENYEQKTRDINHRQYQPDFSIYYTVDGKERRLYLEHFGINKKGQVPKWFAEGRQNKNGTLMTWAQANQEYNEGIKWKRATHTRYNTDLIETTSAMFYDGTWEKVLTENLERFGVQMRLKTAEEIYDELIQRDRHKEETILELITTFVSLLKANCKGINEIIDQSNHVQDERNSFILERIIKPFYDVYQSTLKKKEQIDFTDAILQATEYCNDGKYPKKYRYIIIDEFQDISFDRYKFLLSLRTPSPLGKVFAVGDDWQSIYRFSGSDMGLFSEFPKYFGFTTQCKIETTYRFAQPAIDISSEFIQKNESQVKKKVKTPKKDSTTSISCIGYLDDNELGNSVYRFINNLPSDKTVTIISRYTFDFDIFNNTNGLYPEREKYNYHRDDRNIDITIGNRKVRCLTVHQAKGLEADFVILLKCNSDLYGFPSLISDDPVLEYVLSKHEDSIDYAEERRLFYVAITRAKTHTAIYYLRNNASVFINEIADKIEEDVFKKCPFCGYGHLRIVKEQYARNGSYMVAVGCSNFSASSCDYYQNYFFPQEPTPEQIARLILADPETMTEKVEIERPPRPEKPPRPEIPDWLKTASNPGPASLENTPESNDQIAASNSPRPKVGFVQTDKVDTQKPSWPKRQWPTEYPEGMPSWFKKGTSNENN